MSVDTSSGFKRRSEFCAYIASAAQACPSCVREKTQTERRIGDLLCAPCGAETIERHLNNERIRDEVDPPIREYMDVGTTGPDALESELKRWFPGISQIHSSAIRLKLRVFQICNLMSFISAMYGRTAVQIRLRLAPARVLKNWSICEDYEWGYGVRRRRSTRFLFAAKKHRGCLRARICRRRGRRGLKFIEKG